MIFTNTRRSRELHNRHRDLCCPPVLSPLSCSVCFAANEQAYRPCGLVNGDVSQLHLSSTCTGRKIVKFSAIKASAWQCCSALLRMRGRLRVLLQLRLAHAPEGLGSAVEGAEADVPEPQAADCSANGLLLALALALSCGLAQLRPVPPGSWGCSGGRQRGHRRSVGWTFQPSPPCRGGCTWMGGKEATFGQHARTQSSYSF